MRKARTHAAALALLTAGVLLGGCAGTPAAKAPAAAAPMGADQILPYVHIDGFGTPTDMSYNFV